MFKFSYKTLIFLSGSIWFIVGLMLLTRGLFLIYNTAIWLMVICLIIGFLKGRFILIKSVRRIIKRITSIKEPVPIYKMYAPSYYLLIGSMIMIGFLFRRLDLAGEVRASFDIIIGFALINGSFLTFSKRI